MIELHLMKTIKTMYFIMEIKDTTEERCYVSNLRVPNYRQLNNKISMNARVLIK